MSSDRANSWLFAALSIWSGAFAVMIGLLLSGHVDAVPYHVYEAAGRRFLLHEPLYETVTIDGFQYFPQSALLFAPLAWLGSPVGDVAWRAVGWALYAAGIWRLARLLAPTQAPRNFLLASSLSVICATGSLGNGQANLMLGALMMHVTTALIEESWWQASAIVVFGFALKPLMVVTLLVAWAAYRPLRWRIPLALAGAFVAPWLVRDHAYVMAQYTACLTKLGMCAAPDRLFEDVHGMLATWGWLMPQSVYRALQLAAALGVLGTCLYARSRLSEPFASFFIGALSAGYLMLFNPRTLSTSYVMTVSYAALLAALYVSARHKILGPAMIAIVLAWTVSYRMTGFGFIEYWLRPFACLAFCALLVHRLVVRTRWSSRVRPTPSGEG